MSALASPQLRRFVVALFVALGMMAIALGVTHHSSGSQAIPVKADVNWIAVHPLV